MKLLPIFGALVSFVLCLPLASAAADSMSATPSPLGKPMAKCPSTDPAVIVNTTKLRYMIDTMPNRTAMSGMMNDDKFVCKSAAVKMGAKLKTAPAPMASSKM